MPRTIHSQFDPLRREELMSRAMNWFEEYHWWLVDGGYGTTSDPDRYTDEFTITVKHDRQLGRTLMQLRKSLARHGLTHDAVVTRLPAGGNR
jgi:hypothetical protein